MKIVFIGGGSHRYLSVARSLLGQAGLMDNGEINLYDPAVDRAEAVGRMIQKTPEYAHANCRIVWDSTLDQALENAAVVNVVLMAGTRAKFRLTRWVANRHGFVGSDQLSPSGAMLALKGGPILMDIAKRMERLCPDAWLVNFANPAAVLSAAVNNHTRINCLGVCAGYCNHQWDLTRLLYGKDEQWTDYNILNAGVNHLSFILPGSTHRGQDLLELARNRLTQTDWRPCGFSDRWSDFSKQQMAQGLVDQRAYYLKFGHLIFSSETDGMVHLDMQKGYPKIATELNHLTPELLRQADKQGAKDRASSDVQFRAWLSRDMTDADWNTPTPQSRYLLRDDMDLMARVVMAVHGDEPMSVATSFPNRGAVPGFTDRTVLEYTQQLSRKGLVPAANLSVPGVFQGLIGALANHQTLLGDAIATNDPRVLFEALYNYPVRQDTQATNTMWRELLETAKDEIPSQFAQTKELLQ